jgi:hypothetical protein
MIDNIASLKKAMEQMDAEDPAVAEAAKHHAAQILSDAKLSFAKMAELIEQRRLLLRPKILTSIKRMDQPDMLGDAAFRDTGSALRREGQSFRQIAEAIELNGGPAPRYEDLAQTSEPLHQMDMAIDTDVPAWLTALAFVVNIIFFPVRHPLRFLAIALLAILLFNALRGFAGVAQQASRVYEVMSSVRSFVNKRISWQPQEAAAPATPSAPIPWAVPTTASAPPATTPVPSSNEAGPPAPSSAAPTAPPASTPRLDARSAPSKPAADDRPRTVRPRALEDLMPQQIRRNSRSAGPCIGGAGGCYWGGGRY